MAQKKGGTGKKTTRSKAVKNMPEYKVVMSVKSASLNYTSKRLGDMVSEEMSDGWIPHGNPMMAIEDDEYVMSQAMIKNLS
mgnify:CR=1 FL=1